MKKKTSLPSTFQKMLRELKKLDDELGISTTYFSKLTKKEIQKREEKEAKEETRKKLLNKIWENWPRKTLLSKDVLQMRGNALKNSEVKAFLNKNHIRIEDCGLVGIGCERKAGQVHDCPADCAPEQIQNDLTKWGWGNTFQTWYDYYWGGAKDPTKILFEKADNHRFKVVGLIQMFPEKEKKTA